MKNNFAFLTAILLLLAFGFGCSFMDKATSGGGASDNTAVNSPSELNANAKTGVAECDEFIDMLNKEFQSADDNFVTRKIREYAIDLAKESVKQNIEENKGDKTKIAEGCKEAKAEYLKNKEKNNDSNSNKDANSKEPEVKKDGNSQKF